MLGRVQGDAQLQHRGQRSRNLACEGLACSAFPKRPRVCHEVRLARGDVEAIAGGAREARHARRSGLITLAVLVGKTQSPSWQREAELGNCPRMLCPTGLLSFVHREHTLHLDGDL